MACPKELSVDGFELQFATNHLGHFLFTLLLLPRIIKSAPARIVTIGSVAHVLGNVIILIIRKIYKNVNGVLKNVLSNHC